MVAFSGRGTSANKQKTVTGALQIAGIEDGITAHAGGTKAAAYQLTAAINRITVCATNGDSVMLPAVSVNDVGLQVEIYNDGAADAQVFGNASDTIDAVVTATGVVQGENTRAVYTLVSYAAGVGAWVSNMGVKSA